MNFMNTSDDAVLITAPDDMHRVLSKASGPEQARTFVVWMHERTCARGDIEQATFWETVLRTFGAVQRL